MRQFKTDYAVNQDCLCATKQSLMGKQSGCPTLDQMSQNGSIGRKREREMNNQQFEELLASVKEMGKRGCK